ncbi:MAG: hypothetical protein LC795_04800 [Acidobacteria bacterium]|nr:hypothetical protein [Acidobacteriota bacterium]MCA1618624.1 hypothetical protein [Acidobacteriota bacterium]
MFKGFKLSRITPAAVAVVALLLSLAQSTTAQNATTVTQAVTQTPQTQPPQATPPAQTDASAKSATQVASAPAGETVAAKASPEPLYREYRGVTLGMSASDVRAKLGKPQEKSDEMDFYVFNERERARVYYTKGKATAVIATYIGKDAAAPAPAAVLGSEIEAKPDGSMYRMTPYPHAGYWVAYSRTPGDSPMVMITMQKTP